MAFLNFSFNVLIEVSYCRRIGYEASPSTVGDFARTVAAEL
jgi:hypothetical protein